MDDSQAEIEAHITNERTLKRAENFAKHLAQTPCDVDRVEIRIHSYLEGLGGDQQAWRSPEPLYNSEGSLWHLCNALDFSRNAGNADFVLEGLTAQESTDEEYTAASALYHWADVIAIYAPLTDEDKVRRLPNPSCTFGRLCTSTDPGNFSHLARAVLP